MIKNIYIILGGIAMSERERILALVREGIITTEDAIELLENAAKKQGKDAMRKNKEADFIEENKKDPSKEKNKKTDSVEETEKKDKATFEKILGELATEISFFSSKVDEKAEALQVLRRQISLKEERRQEIATNEELDTMTVELEMEAMRLDEELGSLRSQESALREEKSGMERKMRNLKKEQLDKNVKSFGEKFGNKEEWKETADDINTRLNKFGSRIGELFSSTIDTVKDNVEWKEFDFNMNVPGLVTSKFNQEFIYEKSTATILDFQLANGNITLQKWDKEDIKVNADIRIYAKFEEETPEKAFEARSTILMEEEKFTFHVPNKRVRCDIVVSLPEREYDYVAFKLLNGNVTVDDMKGKDFYIKTTNSQMTLTNLEATMLEIDGVNGGICIEDSKLIDLMAKLVNGDTTIHKSEVASSVLSLVNGDIRMTTIDKETKRIQASIVNGAIKLALPVGKSIELEASSSLGQIKNRISDVEILKQRDDKTNKYLQFRKLADTSPVMVELKTTNGNILLKDTDKSE